MCGGGGKSKPPTPPPAPERVDQDVLAARDRERRRARGAYGQQSTILTGAAGVPVTAQAKTLLGS